jgi:transcriptional regulator with XRE-family HTH domain
MQRVALGISQAALSKKIGVTFQQVQKYEMGVNRIGASRLALIADVLNVPVEYFFYSSAATTNLNDEARSFLATKDGRAFAYAFGRVTNAAKRQGVMLLVNTLAEAFPDVPAST